MLAYHGVNKVAAGDDPDRLVLAPRLLERQLRLLQRLGYSFCTAAQLADRGADQRPPAATAVATFDDGWSDALSEVLPLLQRLRISASFYVCPGWWGGQHPLVSGEAGRLLDADGARALHEAGMEVGSHTLTHPDLRGLDDVALATELRDSREAVAAATGAPCRTLAYPYGLSDARVRAAAGAAGYELSLGWLPGPWDRFDVPRLPGPPRHGAARLAVKLLAGVRRPGR